MDDLSEIKARRHEIEKQIAKLEAEDTELWKEQCKLELAIIAELHEISLYINCEMLATPDLLALIDDYHRPAYESAIIRLTGFRKESDNTCEISTGVYGMHIPTNIAIEMRRSYLESVGE